MIQLFAPLVTPFHSDESIDDDAFLENLSLYDRAPLDGYVINGSSGEAEMLTQEERVRMVKMVASNTRRPIIAGVAAESVRATLEELQSYVSELQPVAEAVESLSKSLAHSKPSQAPESGISAELQETMGQLTEVVSDVRRDVQAYRQEITRLSSQVTDLGRLPTNILQVSGVMERDPTTILYRTRVVLYPERKPSQPSAEKPQVFSEGSVVLTPSSFSAQPEPVVSVDDSVYSPARASLHGLGGGAVSPGNSTLP